MTTQLGDRRESALVTLARNVSTRYILILVNLAIGLFMVRYNVNHLGLDDYGLWMLAASITTYFGVLEMGYGGTVVKFVAEFRAKGDARALNETLSTMFYVFAAIAVACMVIAAGVAAVLPAIINVQPGQEQTARIILLLISLQVALYFPFSVYGGVINGFERYYMNNVVGIGFNVATALVNVLILWWGYGLIELVAATTVMRIAPFWVYRHNAYRTFPELLIRWSLVRRERLRELTGFSVYLAAIDWSARLTFATDAIFIGIFMTTAAVTVYSVAQRLSDALLTLTHQFHTYLFPAVVARSVRGHLGHQQTLLIKATRLQLAVAVCLCGAVAADAGLLIPAWMGLHLSASAPVAQLLACVVVLRSWVAMPSTVLKGTQHHKYLAKVSALGAVANLLLSILLVQTLGILGVTLGTAMAVAVTSAVFIFPRACRVVGLTPSQGYIQVVWPAAWPAAFMVALLLLTQSRLPGGAVPVIAHLIAGAAIYGGLFFFFGLSRDERRWVSSAVDQIRRGRAGLAAA